MSGKPDERRELFDEAAGIVKFKKRKATAEKNLDAEQQNLMRVQDILSELEKQVGPLEEQSHKAKEYLRLKDELKNYEVGLFRMDYESLHQETEDIEKNLADTRHNLEEAKQEKEQSRSEYDSVETAITEFDQSVERKKEKVNKDKLLINNFEGEVRITKEKIASVTQGKEYYKERSDALSATKQAAESELSEYTANQKETLDKLTEMEQKEHSVTEQLNAIEKDILEKEIELNQQNETILDSMNTSSKITVEQQKAKSMLEQNSIRRTELNQKILANKSQFASAEEEMKQEEQFLKEAKKELDNEYVARKNLLAEADQKRNSILELQQKQQENQKQYHTMVSKLDTLKNMAERYDGYGHSIRHVMEQKKSQQGIIGVVADIIQVQDRYITAVETALGGNIQNIVTEDEHVARHMIEYLKTNRFGRATFLPLTTVTPKKDNAFTEEMLDEDGVIGHVASKVERDKRFDNIVNYLLGRYLLVDTIEHAMKISKKYHHTLRIVTLEGELLNPGGSMSGGSFKNNSNLLGRRKELKQLEKEIQAKEKAIADCKEEIAGVGKEVEELVAKANEKAQSLKELELKENTAKVKYEQAVSIKEQKEKEYLAIANEGKEIENQKSLLEDSLSRIGSDLALSKQQEEDAKKQVQILSDELDEAHEKQLAYQEQLAKIHLEISSFQQKNNYVAENIHRIQENLLMIEEEYNHLLEEQQNSDDTVVQMEEAIVGFETKCKELNDEIEQLLVEIEDESRQKEEMMASQKDIFEKRDALMNHISELDKETFRLESRKQNIEEKLEEKVNHMWNEYELTYHNAMEIEVDESI